MARLTAPSGVVVDVADDKVAWLTDQGFTAQDDKGAKPARRTRKASAKTSDDE